LVISIEEVADAKTPVLALPIFSMDQLPETQINGHRAVRRNRLLCRTNRIAAQLALALRHSLEASFGWGRYANVADIRSAGLFPGEGETSSALRLGAHRQGPLRLHAPFTFGIVSPRSPAGVLLESAAAWPGSMVCLDFDGTYAEAAIAARADRQPVYRFDPSHSATYRCNPLAWLSAEPAHYVAELQSIARLFWPRDPKDYRREFAGSLFQGVVLYLRDSGDVPTLGETLRTASHYLKVDPATLASFAAKRQDEGFPLSPQTVRALNGFCALPQETKAAVLETFNSGLSVFSDEQVDRATSANDLDIATLRTHPQTLFLCIAESQKDRLAPFLNLLISQALIANMRALPDSASAVDTLFLLDGVASLGRIALIERKIDQFARHRLSLLMGYPSRAKLVEAYGEKGAACIEKHYNGQALVLPAEGADATSRNDVLIAMNGMKPIRATWKREE
jgi:type IV secretion system protein VirD4